jgi:hypothetical protein
MFVLRVCAEPGVDAIRSLRAWLKRGLREFGLRCIAIYEAKEGGEVNMTSISAKYPKTGLFAAKDLEAGNLVLQIHYVAWDELIGSKSRDVVYFTNDDRRLVLNYTNAHRIAKLYGDDGDKWQGHWIELYLDPDVEFDGRKQPGVRVAEKRPSISQEGNGPLPPRPQPRQSRRDELDEEIPF